MAYLLALIALVAVAILCWKLFGPGQTPHPGGGRNSEQHSRIIGPEDDPEFLWRISRQHRDGDPGSDR